MININAVCDYIILKTTEGGGVISLLKLQKLLYYVQVWYLVFNKKPLFSDKFQAWVHGPVCRAIYNRFSDKTMYSVIEQKDIQPDFDSDCIPADDQEHINNVLEVYAQYSGTQLETLSHLEEPWQNARKGYKPADRCEVEISDTDIISYYSKKL